MANVHYGKLSFPANPGESVLDCLLRNDVPISHSCKAGACQSCLIRGCGSVPESAQRGLKETLRAQGYFLACSLRPVEDIAVAPAVAGARIEARISGLESMNDTVLRVRLRTDTALDYYAGQFVTVFRDDGLARSYSLASLPHENELELHVRKIPGGAMSGWLHRLAENPAGPNTQLWLQGPSGNCFYTPGSNHEPLLLAGTGTGLAPLYGVLRDALLQGHRGPVCFMALSCRVVFI